MNDAGEHLDATVAAWRSAGGGLAAIVLAPLVVVGTVVAAAHPSPVLGLVVLGLACWMLVDHVMWRDAETAQPQLSS